MANMTADEYGIVAQALLKSESYLKENEKGFNPQKLQDIQDRMNQAMGAMQAVNKRMKDKSVPTGGSSMCKDDKIKDLFQTFTLNR